MTDRTRVFVEAHMFDHGYEGSATFVAGLYRALLAAYPDRYELVLGGRNPQNAMTALGSPPQAVPAPYRSAGRFGRLAFDVPRIVRQTGADYAHFQYFTPPTKQCGWIVTIHDVLFNDFRRYFPKSYRRLRNVLFPLSARRADILTTVSDYSRERIAYWYGLDPDRIVVTPNGVESAAVSAQHRAMARAAGQPNGRYLICVSRFEPRKNQAAVLAAFVEAALWRRGVSLVFVGARTLNSPAFDAAWAAAPDEARAAVHFLSDLPPEALTAMIAGAEAAVYPSLAEGFGLPPLEALAQDVPSICARVTAMADFRFLEPFFFDPALPGDLTRRLAGVLDAPDKARAAAATARAAMLDHYSWARAAEALHGQIAARAKERPRR